MKKSITLTVIMIGLAAGCTSVKTPQFKATSWGLQSSQAVQGLNVTVGTNGTVEVILDSSSGSQNSTKLIDGLIAVGEVVGRAKAAGYAEAQAKQTEGATDSDEVK